MCCLNWPGDHVVDAQTRIADSLHVEAEVALPVAVQLSVVAARQLYRDMRAVDRTCAKQL